MFFDEDEDRLFEQQLVHIPPDYFLSEVLLGSNLPLSDHYSSNVPTHTEDGIPIRKLYVSNLPPKTSRSELFSVFTQYGMIKSCWVRFGEKGAQKVPSPTYAFVTFNNPADAHKALVAPNHEKSLRGRTLKISPADSWHQPSEDAEGNVHWKRRGQFNMGPTISNEAAGCNEAADTEGAGSNEATVSTESSETDPTLGAVAVDPSQLEEEAVMEQEAVSEDEEYNILDVLNTDCLNHILGYVPIRDLIRSEQVSKRWHCMVQEYFQGIRLFKTYWWKHNSIILTTAVLRKVLQRVGQHLLRLHIDHHWSALNDRTAHTVGKFCPNLEEIKIVGMNTRNWNPLIYGCKHLKHLFFISCNKLTDSSLIPFVKSDQIESLTIANNSHITGLFLTGCSPPNLTSLSFYNCYNLQGTVLSTAINSLPNLTVLRLDAGPLSLWKLVPAILKKLPKLQTLSLSEYMAIEVSLVPTCIEGLCEAIKMLPELKNLNFARNMCVTSSVIKSVAQACPKLETLNVSSCNTRKNIAQKFEGVNDEAITHLCRSCHYLRTVDVSYLGAITDAGVTALKNCQQLQTVTARGCPALTSDGFISCLQCPMLKEIDACGCDGVTDTLIIAADATLQQQPRLLTLWLAGTAVAKDESDEEKAQEEAPRHHKLLIVDLEDDRCNPQLRPDFVDHVYDDSDNSTEELYDPYDMDDHHMLYSSDDDFLVDDDLDEFDFQLEWGIRARDIILL